MKDEQQNQFSFDQYQEEAARTGSDYSHVRAEDIAKLVYALGLVGEAGELSDLIKKNVAHGHPITKDDRDKLVKELGDVFWYLSQIAREYGILLSEVAKTNILKLRARYPHGFSIGDSIVRKDTQNG